MDKRCNEMTLTGNWFILHSHCQDDSWFICVKKWTKVCYLMWGDTFKIYAWPHWYIAIKASGYLPILSRRRILRLTNRMTRSVNMCYWKQHLSWPCNHSLPLECTRESRYQILHSLRRKIRGLSRISECKSHYYMTRQSLEAQLLPYVAPASNLRINNEFCS